MRRKIVAANWKMNKTFSEAEELIQEIGEALEDVDNKNVEVVICPSFLFLEMATDYAQDFDFSVGAQNVNENEKGAYTGEVSVAMLKSVNVEYCIVGHSERRAMFNETNQQIAKKIDILLKEEIIPIFCCGEQLQDREKKEHFNVVKQQIEEGLFIFEPLDFSKIVIAYEPVWAIGTGVTATSDQAEEMHAFIRGLIAEKYGKEVSRNTSILYGGSCNAKNAAELFAKENVDGGLIGGASLVAEDFITIVDSF